VVRDGHPTPGVNVEARARLDEFGVIHRLRLGTSGEDGIVRGELDGDARFELIACGENGLPLADGEAGLTAQPGGSIERTLEIRSGTLRIELPKSVFWRFSDQIVVDLHGRGQAPIRRTIRAHDLVAFHTQIQEHTLVFEKLRVGAYEGHLHLEHDVSVVSSGESGAKATTRTCSWTTWSSKGTARP
jgi:hypothetical protein